jgi:cobalt/nickel transport system permease protein
MHMSDALLSPAVGTTFWGATVITIRYASRKLRENMDERMVPLMGVLGAFIFAAQMINFTIPGTGSSGHLGGGLLLAIVLGPYEAFLVMASVLTVQSLFFADGGLLALGCNIWNLAVYPCFIALPLIFRPLTRNSQSRNRIVFAALLSAVIGLQMGAFSVVIQTLLSGKSELPFWTFLLLMQPVHLAIGIVEGIVTAAVVLFVHHMKPEILESIPQSGTRTEGLSMEPLIVAFIIAAVFTGGVLSWFASSRPDGLEWSIEKVYGRSQLPEKEHGMTELLKGLQEKTAFLPDYGLPDGTDRRQDRGETSWPGPDIGTSLSGVIGAAIVLGVSILVGVGIRVIRSRSS